MSKTIEIVVTPTGQTQVQTRGFVGSECRQASQFIEQARTDANFVREPRHWLAEIDLREVGIRAAR
jgi:hypothetical protein